MNKKTSAAMFGLLCLLGLWLLAGCSKKEETKEVQPSTPAATAAPAPAATPLDPNTVASVSGSVKFDGAAPKPAKIDMSQDPACKGTNTAETIVDDGGKLANVFVYVKDGLGDRAFDVPKAAVIIDQQGCKYHPHVLGVMTGQNIEIKNDDQPRTTFTPRRNPIASGTSLSRRRLLRSRKASPAKKSCCR